MRLLKKLLVAAALVVCVLLTAVSANNNVSDISIDVTVRNDGSAYVVQNWSGNFSEGTENYIPIATKDIGISQFKVADLDGEYSFVENWDINAGFEAKKRKCGINRTDEGVELCFGISEYGEHKYAIEYVVSDFIKSYSDYDGTNFMFINPNMSTFPTNGNIRIVLDSGEALNEDNAAIWAFGFEGEIQFENGAVVASTASALEGDNSMIVMLRLNKGVVSPGQEMQQSFEDVMNKAFEGSDYGYYDYGYSDEETSVFERILEYVIGFVILFSIPALLIFVIALIIKRKREIKKFYNEANYFRDVPNGGRIELSHYLAQSFGVAWNKSLIIGALMLSMINKGCIEPQTEEDIGMFGKVKQKVNLKLLKAPDTNIENRLYKVLVSAAGADGILQEKELEKYAFQNPDSVNGIIDSAMENGRTMFANEGGFIKGVGRNIKNLSDKGKTELAEVMGLKKFLEEFSLISEREIKETLIWQDYMVYATLFGIADKAIEQFKKVYPNQIPEFDDYNRNVIIAHSYYRSMQSSAERAMQQERTSGLGGHSSIGGGGGFSGGGSGGGSR